MYYWSSVYSHIALDIYRPLLGEKYNSDELQLIHYSETIIN